ncbi:MAG TPA: hypothetical protein VGF79_15720 [Bacteroidia bacterium]
MAINWGLIVMRSIGIISSSRRWRYQPEVYPFMEAIGMPNSDLIYHEGTTYERSGKQFWTQINELIINWKTALGLPLDFKNLYSRLPLVYPTIGGTATSHKYNLSDPSKFVATFFGGWTHDGSGAQPNGTNAYMTTTTGLFVNMGYSMESATFGFDSKTDANGLYLDLRATDGARPNIILYARNSGSAYSQFDYSLANSIDAVPDSLGLYMLNRVNANLFEVIKENAVIGSHSKTCGHEISSGVLNGAGYSGGQYSPRKRTLTFGASKSQGNIGGFTPTERTDFTNHWRNFDNSLNR